MALKADRYELQTDISFFCNEATGRGGIVCHDSTAGSGAAMDQGVNLVVTKSTIANTDTPLGILLNDVTDKDLTRTHLNQHKDEVAKGGKVTKQHSKVVRDYGNRCSRDSDCGGNSECCNSAGYCYFCGTHKGGIGGRGGRHGGGWKGRLPGTGRMSSGGRIRRKKR